MTWRRIALIGASGGIGNALAIACEARGGRTYRLARNASSPDLQIDIEDEASIARAALHCSQEGLLDLVIVATGALQGEGFGPEKDWRQLSGHAFARSFSINATGPALVAKHFLPLLPRERRSVFAVLSARVGSISDNRLGGWYSYRASKAALNMIVKSLAIELARKRPDAVCVALHPGTVDTSLSRLHQSNVPQGSLFTPKFAADRLLAVIDGLHPHDSGACLAWDGSRIDP